MGSRVPTTAAPGRGVRTLTIKLPDWQGEMPELQDELETAILRGMDAEKIFLHTTTIERIAQVVFNFLVEKAEP